MASPRVMQVRPIEARDEVPHIDEVFRHHFATRRGRPHREAEGPGP
jgi:hypothetical protein